MPAALATAAHALKGAAGNVGAMALHVAAGVLEAQAKSGMPSDAVLQAHNLRELWAATRAAIGNWPKVT
jgi:HPt (histidine-containing phosphotransfer) domain-containing protein